jgi:small multidrug resistance pump
VETKTLAILVAATMSAVGILGDYFLKRASEAPQPLATRSFVLGFVLYAIYAMCMILLLALMGVVVFNEPLHRSEIVGIVLALAALVLLARFG